MNLRFITTVLMIGAVLGSVAAGVASARQSTLREDHVAWVAEALNRMQTIKLGMTRKELGA